MSLALLVDRATDCLLERAGAKPHWIAAAPGRVNLIGEHVDYNDGFVLPLAIDRHVVVAALPRDDRVARWFSATANQSFEVALDKTIVRGEPAWSNYVRGVMAGFAERGVSLPGFDAVIVSDVPLGGGLSSSAALEVAVATLIESMGQHTLDPIEKALLCQKAEHTFAGMPCGVMDQFASTLARRDNLLLIDCRSLQFEHVPMTDDDLVIMVIDTGVKHELTDGGYAARRAQCESAARKLGVSSLRDISWDQLETRREDLTEVEWKRARHVVTEIGRTLEAVAAIRERNYQRLGELMAASHRSLRDDYEVSCVELDRIVELAGEFSARHPGQVVGSRMTGGGFGGSSVCLIKKTVAESLSGHIVAKYREEFSFEPNLFVTPAGAGARALL